MTGATALTAGTMSGIFTSLGAVVTEIGDTLQALIAALQATNVWDEDVTTVTTHRRKVRGSNPPKYHEEVVTRVKHYKVNLFEVVLAGMVLGLWGITQMPDKEGKVHWGLSIAPVFGVAGAAGAAVDPESPYWWMTPWGTAIEVWKQLSKKK